MPYAGNQVVGKEGVQVVGKKYIRLFEQKKQEKAKIILRIEERPLSEKQPHAVHAVSPLVKGKAVFSLPADQHDIKTHLYKGVADAINPLVGHKVIGYGNDDPLHSL